MRIPSWRPGRGLLRAVAFALLASGNAAAGGPAVTVTQSSSLVPTAGSAAFCVDGSAHRETSIYRVFDLAAELGGLTPFHVAEVEYGIELANDGMNLGQPVDVRLYTLDALPLTLAGLTPIASESSTVFDQELTTAIVPITATVAPTALLVVEIHVPDGMASGDLLRFGANTAGQSGLSYMRAPSCVISQIESLPNLGYPNVAWVMAVRGTRDVPAAPPACTSAHATFENTTPAAVTDTSVVTSTIDVSGMAKSLLDVNLQTFLRHTFAADVEMTITSPTGTVVTLTTDNGAGSDDVFDGTVWDDDADPDGPVPYATSDGLVTDHPYVSGTLAPRLVPEEGLLTFLGEDPNGTWTLTIADDLTGEGGTLDAWSLELTALEDAPEASLVSYANTTPVSMDAEVVTSTIDVSGAPEYLGRLTLQTDLAHSFAADVDMTLTSPQGTVVTITTDNGAGSDDVFAGTTWFAGANPAGQVPYATNDGMVTDHAYVNLTPATPLTPEESFGAFTGENPNGTWTLTVSDDLAGDGGTLHEWSLGIETLACVATTTTTLGSEPTTTTTTITTVASTSTTVVGMTTTTTLPGCARAASVASIRCRLTDMRAQAPATLARLLARADAAVAKADRTGAGTPAGRRAVKKATRFVKKFQKKLGTKAGRGVPDGARPALRDGCAALLADLAALA